MSRLMIRLYVAALAASLLLSACESVKLPPTQEEISAQDVIAHISYFASDELHGRKAGSPDEMKAARYIKKFFQKHGLQPAGKNGDYLFPFEVVTGMEAGSGNRLQITEGEKTRELVPGKDFQPLSFTENGTFSGELVFVGYGITARDLHYDDYAGVDVRDKIVVALRYSPEGDNPHGKFYPFAALRRKASTAREKGARGILFVTGPKQADDEDLIPLRYDNSPARAGIGALSVRRDLIAGLLQAAGKDLAAVQSRIDSTRKPLSFALGNVSVEFTADVKEIRRTAHNVAAMLPGTDPKLKDEIIVIGAHFDHLGLGGSGSLAPEEKGQVHNGADDNASGTAGVLELAERFASAANPPKRSLLFITFSAEEMGLLGSRAYVDDPDFSGDRVVAMINMDMIGRMKNRRLIVHGLGTSPSWNALLDSLNKKPSYQFELKLNKEGVGPSDHSSFYQKGIPVLFFFTGLHDDYHKPSDDVDKINSEGEADVLHFVYDVVRAIDGMPERPQFTRVQMPQRRTTRGRFRVYLGTIPDYAETDVEGMKLSGVRKGGPAERAGLRGGDVIIQFGDRSIKNIYDFTYALQDARPGEEVDIVVLRNGKKMTFHMKLEGRKRK